MWLWRNICIWRNYQWIFIFHRSELTAYRIVLLWDSTELAWVISSDRMQDLNNHAVKSILPALLCACIALCRHGLLPTIICACIALCAVTTDYFTIYCYTLSKASPLPYCHPQYHLHCHLIDALPPPAFPPHQRI